jgi:magnesium transporter
MEAVVDRLADILEGEARQARRAVEGDLRCAAPPGQGRDRLQAVLQRIGRAEDLNGKVSESLSTLQRLLGYLPPRTGGAREFLAGIERMQLKSLTQDIRSCARWPSTQGARSCSCWMPRWA